MTETVKLKRDRGATGYARERYHIFADDSAEKALCGRTLRLPATLKTEIDWEAKQKVGVLSVCGSCQKKHNPPASIKLTTAEMKALHARAVEAGERAWRAAVPVPMTVYTPANLMGSLTGGDDGGPDPNEPIYHVAEGACGFGWVSIHPANSRFANFLKRECEYASTGYRGGLEIPEWSLSTSPEIRASQSIARKEAFVTAYAGVIREAGITAYGHSRLD